MTAYQITFYCIAAIILVTGCLLYTSDAADERSSVDLGGRRIIKKKKSIERVATQMHNEKTTHDIITNNS